MLTFAVNYPFFLRYPVSSLTKIMPMVVVKNSKIRRKGSALSSIKPNMAYIKRSSLDLLPLQEPGQRSIEGTGSTHNDAANSE